MTKSYWPSAPLGTVATIRSGFAFKSSQWKNSGIPVVKIANVKRGRLDLSSIVSHVSLPDAQKAEQYRLYRGDILIGMTGYVGEVARVKTDDHLLLNQRVGRVLLHKSRVNEDFLYFALSSSEFRQAAISLGSGSAQSNISPAQLESIGICLPPLPEQKRIADVLGAFDDLIETNRRLSSDLLSLLFSKYEVLARDRDTSTFGKVASLVRDQWNPGYEHPGTYLGLEHFATDGAGLIGSGEADSVNSTSLRFHPGDVLYGKLRPYFRKVARPGFAGICSSEIWVLRAQADYPQSLVHALAHAASFSEAATAGSTGTRMPRADWKHISTMQVPALRTRDLDPDVLDGLETLWAVACDLDQESTELSRQRDELLPLLMSGKVLVRDLEAVA